MANTASSKTKSEPVVDAEFVPDQMTEEEVAQAMGGTAVEISQQFSREQYASIQSFNDAMALALDTYDTVVDASQDPNLGTGFKIAQEDDKDRLCGVPMLLLDWRFNVGDHGDKDYVSIHAVDAENRKWVINDGGTGICRDLREYTGKTGRKGGLMVKRGLRFSEYPTNPEGGLQHLNVGQPLKKDEEMILLQQGKRPGHGKTFYLDFSA